MMDFFYEGTSMKISRILVSSLFLFCLAISAAAKQNLPESIKIQLNGLSAGHIQGVAADEKYIYLSYSTKIVKCDWNGVVVKIIDTPRFDGLNDPRNDIAALKKKYNIRHHHSGDCCFHDGKLYVAYCGSGFNKYLNGGMSYNYVYVFNPDLNFIRRHHVPEMEFGAGGITFANGKFYLVGGRPRGITGNTVYEYDSDFRLLKKHYLDINSALGIQTISFDGRYFWIGCYGVGIFSFRFDQKFQLESVFDFQVSTGMLHSADGKTIMTFRDKIKKGKIDHTLAKRENVDSLKGEIHRLEIGGDGKFSFRGKTVSPDEIYSVLRRKNYSRDILFIHFTRDTPAQAVASAVLTAQQTRINFQLIQK